MRLTPMAKILITLLVLGAIAVVLYKNRAEVEALIGRARGGGTGTAANPGGGPAADTDVPSGSIAQPGKGAPAVPGARKRIVVGVNDFGGAYPALVANDGATAGPASLFAKEGLDVEIKLGAG